MAALHKYRYPVLISLVGLFGSLSAHAVELTVQIGAFGDRPNPTFAEQAAQYGELLVVRGTDGITRVSIGRYANKAAAREALQRLQISGYPDAYIANVSGRGTAIATFDQPAPSVQPTQTANLDRTPSVATTPEGRPIVAPKRPAADADAGITQAGRFRLRTHDTQSGRTSDVELADSALPPGSPTSGAVIAGLGANEIPQHLRDKLVYLDGVPHIKEGERFIPLTDVIDGK